MSSSEAREEALARAKGRSFEHSKLIVAILLLIAAVATYAIYMENRYEPISGEVISKESRIEDSIALAGKTVIPTTVTKHYLTVSYPATGSNSNVTEEIFVRKNEFQSCEPEDNFSRTTSGSVSCGEVPQ